MTTWRPTRPRVWLRAVALVVCWLITVWSALPLFAFAAPAGSGDDNLTLTADRVEYNSQTRRVQADGHARATGRGAVITADHIEADLAAQEVLARGNVTLTQGDKTLNASLLRYNLITRTGHVEQAAGQLQVWHVSAETIDLAPEQDVATEASLTPCDPDHPLYKVTAKKAVITPDQTFTAYDATLWVAGTHIITVPVYTAKANGRSGPSLGYDNLDGIYLEYANSFPLGSWRDDYRIRLGTITGLSAENNLSRRFGDYIFSLDLGRTQLKNRGGVILNVDRYAVDVVSDRIRIPGWPLDVSFEGHAGSYGEIARSVTSTRVGASVTLASDTFVLGESVYFSAGGRIHFDGYGTGDHQTVFEGSAALTAPLGPGSRASLVYTSVIVDGMTPFTFDAYGATSTVTLNYYHLFGGFLQSAYASVSYDFLAGETTLGLTAAMSINRNTEFDISAYYSLLTGQLNEIDYALNLRCDCASIGLVYQTFPYSPSRNAFMVTVELNVGPSVTFSGTGVKSE